jgi:uncharacterized OsmC-like protein
MPDEEIRKIVDAASAANGLNPVDFVQMTLQGCLAIAVVALWRTHLKLVTKLFDMHKDFGKVRDHYER